VKLTILPLIQIATLPSFMMCSPKTLAWRTHAPFPSTISFSSFANREREQIVLTGRRKSVREMDAYSVGIQRLPKIPDPPQKFPVRQNIFAVSWRRVAKNRCRAAALGYEFTENRLKSRVSL
jgi:hypothetical protein